MLIINCEFVSYTVRQRYLTGVNYTFKNLTGYFNDFNFGKASAEALVLFFIIATFSIVQFKFLSTEVEY